ncbi:MAG TPA: amino acid ABC transporter substrate-binding protein [Trueperaceae bacterium]
MNPHRRPHGPLVALCLALLSLWCAAPAQGAPPPEPPTSTLARVRSRGHLICGVNGSLPGFSLQQADRHYSGFDVDFCRAIAAAVLGNADAVDYLPLNAQERFPALLQGKIDVLIRNTTWTSSRDAKLELSFAPTTFYDGQGVLVRAGSGIDSLADLSGQSICVQQGTTTELNLADRLRLQNIPYNAVIFLNSDLAVEAFLQGICDAFTTDKSGIASLRSQFAQPSQYRILDATLSKEPLGPVVREGDPQWRDLVTWVVYGLIQAEEYGITSANVEQVATTSAKAPVRRFLGASGNLWEALGLDAAAIRRAIAQVGNYGEIYRRNLGPGSNTEIPRGLNRLFSDGGLLYAPPAGPR